MSVKWGTFFKATDRVKPDSVAQIDYAYNSAFWNPESPDEQRPCEALNDIFKRYKDDLCVLEAIRNILVHQGGKIDQDFLDSIHGKDHCLGKLEVPKKLLLSGDSVVRYAKSALNFSKDLLSFVDGWLVKYPP